MPSPNPIQGSSWAQVPLFGRTLGYVAQIAIIRALFLCATPLWVVYTRQNDPKTTLDPSFGTWPPPFWAVLVLGPRSRLWVSKSKKNIDFCAVPTRAKLTKMERLWPILGVGALCRMAFGAKYFSVFRPHSNSPVQSSSNIIWRYACRGPN